MALVREKKELGNEEKPQREEGRVRGQKVGGWTVRKVGPDGGAG